MGSKMESLAGVSKESVIKATGHSWQNWIDYLDKHKATKLSHKEIVSLLSEKINKSWWCQKIANGYEQVKGLREKGQTADAGFQIGVSRTFPIDKDTLWDKISSKKGMKIWLGNLIEEMVMGSYKTREGITGKITVLKDGSHFRMSWKPKAWKQPSVLQVRAIAGKDKSVLSFHQEKLPDSGAREQMKKYWKNKVDEIGKWIERDIQTRK